MCGRLRLEEMHNRIGNLITIGHGNVNVQFDDGAVYPAMWNGHAREESLASWHDAGWEDVAIINVAEFTEGKGNLQKSFKINQGFAIKAIARAVGDGLGTMIVNIVTREATVQERATHPRWPVFVRKEPKHVSTRRDC